MRYQLIEIIALWEDVLLPITFVVLLVLVGSQPALKDISAYRENCPENLIPVLKAISPAMYLVLPLNISIFKLACIFENSEFPISYAEVMAVQNRIITPEILRPIPSMS